MYRCTVTGYEEDVKPEEGCVHREVFKHRADERTLVLSGDMAADPTLQRTYDTPCPQCGKRDAAVKGETTLKGMDLYFQCVQCRHEWSDVGDH